MRSIRSSGVGNCLFLRAQEWGIDLQERKILQIPGGMPARGGGGSKIAACITQDLVLFVTHASSAQWQRVKGLRDAP